jgi:hypothetical protein
MQARRFALDQGNDLLAEVLQDAVDCLMVAEPKQVLDVSGMQERFPNARIRVNVPVEQVLFEVGGQEAVDKFLAEMDALVMEERDHD